MKRDHIFICFVCFVMGVTFSVGKVYGRRTAPEYVRQKEIEHRELMQVIEADIAQYQGSHDQVCDQIFELVQDQLIHTSDR